MSRNRLIIRILVKLFALALVTWLLAACVAPDARQESTAFPIPSPGLKSSPSAPPANAAEAGGALLALGRHGHVSVLGQDGWLEPSVTTNLSQGSSCEPGKTAAGFGAGQAWVQCQAIAASRDGGSHWLDPTAVYPGRLYFGPGDRVAAVSPGQVILLSGESRASYLPGPSIGATSFPASAATFAPDGTLWLADESFGGLRLASFDGQSWQTYGSGLAGLGSGEADEIRALLVSRQNVLYAATRNRLLYFDGSRFQQVLGAEDLGVAIRIPSLGGVINDLLELPNGEIWLASSEGIFVWNGRNLSVLDRGDGLPARDVRALALDARGRVWAATAYGLAVRDGRSWQAVLPATSGLAESDLVALAVRGAPVLPPPDRQPRTATLGGRVVSAGAGGRPVANAPVILCNEWPGANQRHAGPVPCADNLEMRMSKTDGDGWYRFDNVPLGSYTLAVNENGMWYFSLIVGSQEKLPLVALTPGQQVRLDVGLP